ncbi:MAG: alkaline phosphatase family protein [Proteobacteria bacterium]|nr:alkaline phosphatase family protein [Pseudomonadota bacterium]
MIDRVVVVIFDGLRPDVINDALMPNLAALRRRGTWFSQARSVFPSVTRVAAASIASGTMPAQHGVINNRFYHPKALAERPLELGGLPDILRLSAIGEAPLCVPTYADVLAAHGKQMAVVHGGTPGACYFSNPKAAQNGHWVYSIHGREATVTPDTYDEVRARFGAEPRHGAPCFETATRLADVYVDHVLPRIDPDVAFIWFPEPDTSFHHIGISAKETHAVLTHTDAQLGRILAAIEARGASERTAVLVASDHGQITVDEEVAIFNLLADAGFAVGTALRDGLAVMGVGGRAGELRVMSGDPALRDDLVAWLREQPFTGLLFSADKNGVEGQAPGTFSMKLVGADHRRAPDIVFVLRCWQERDPAGLPGRGLLFAGEVPVGCGTHGGLNRQELTSTLILAGPGMPENAVVDVPVGIVDIAPTVLSLLGLPTPPTMTGRSLAASAAGSGKSRTPANLETGLGSFAQRLSISRGARDFHLLEGMRLGS